MKSNLTLAEVRERLRQAVEEAGGVVPWTRRHNLAPGNIRRILSGHIAPFPKALAPLGIERIAPPVIYRDLSE